MSLDVAVNINKETSDGTFENTMQRESSADKTQKMDEEIEKEITKNNVMLWLTNLRLKAYMCRKIHLIFKICLESTVSFKLSSYQKD